MGCFQLVGVYILELRLRNFTVWLFCLVIMGWCALLLVGLWLLKWVVCIRLV